jgi:xylulokinase
MAARIDSPILFGVDVGTQSIRCLAFAADGALLHMASRPTPTIRRQDGADHDPDLLFTCVETCLRETVDALPRGASVAGVAVASVGETTVLVDAAGRAVAPALAWFDRRPEAAANAIESLIGAERLFELTGHRIDPTHGLCKLWWMRGHWPDAFSRARMALNVADWIAFRLSGVAATDFTLASRTLALDIKARAWSTEILNQLGFDPRLFAPLRPSGAPLGPMRSDIALSLGFSKPPMVGVGGHDHLCGLFAAGAARPGVLLDSIGTAEAILRTMSQPIVSNDVHAQGFTQGAIATHRDLFYVGGGINSAGGAIEWFRQLTGNAPYDALIAEARAVAPVDQGVVFLPLLAYGAAPEPDVAARGAFIGLTKEATRASLYRAVLEGLCLQMRRMSEAVASLSDVGAAREIRVIGGGSRNPLLMSIKASVLAQPLFVMDEAEATALGAALLGGVAAGLWKDLDTAVAGLERRFRIVEPEPAWIDIYAALYERVFRNLQGSLKTANNQLAALEVGSALRPKQKPKV